MMILLILMFIIINLSIAKYDVMMVGKMMMIMKLMMMMMTKMQRLQLAAPTCQTRAAALHTALQYTGHSGVKNWALAPRGLCSMDRIQTTPRGSGILALFCS